MDTGDCFFYIFEISGKRLIWVLAHSEHIRGWISDLSPVLALGTGYWVLRTGHSCKILARLLAAEPISSFVCPLVTCIVAWYWALVPGTGYWVLVGLGVKLGKPLVARWPISCWSTCLTHWPPPPPLIEWAKHRPPAPLMSYELANYRAPAKTRWVWMGDSEIVTALPPPAQYNSADQWILSTWSKNEVCLKLQKRSVEKKKTSLVVVAAELSRGHIQA